ncbi:MAG: F0F1 ATP synthase subunit gamma [Alphaproteobacteria bacterium]|nr:F0F1 ATP synthase subunit gamma [Alphaproteobacteria bacterium]
MSLEILKKRIQTTTDLKEIVSTMKSLSSASVGQYEKALVSLYQYGQTVKAGFNGLTRADFFTYQPMKIRNNPNVLAVVIGSDNGLVGRFNRDLMSFTEQTLNELHPNGEKHILAIGKRIGLLAPLYHLHSEGMYPLSNSVKEISIISGIILTKIHELIAKKHIDVVYLFFNQKQGNTAFISDYLQVIPLPSEQFGNVKKEKWQGRMAPLITASKDELFQALVREYLVVVLAHALTASLASEHYTRMLHMQEAERNIDDSLSAFNLEYQQLRQNQITDELIDIVSGSEQINKQKNQSTLDFLQKTG